MSGIAPAPATPDHARIEAIYRAHGHMVLRRARQLLGSDDEAQEALHNVFLALVHDPAQLEDARSITAWLYGMVTHHCLNVLRNRKTRARLLDEVAPATGAQAEGPRAEATAWVKRLLDRLPEPLAAVAVFAYVDELTQDEIADVMGCSRRHVVNLIARLRAWTTEERPS